MVDWMLGETLILLTLAFVPTLLIQMLALGFVGRVRLVGWFVMILATLVMDICLTFLTFSVVPQLYGSAWLYIPILVAGNLLPWLIPPWRRLRVPD